MDTALPPFDVTAKCAKCGYVIPDPVEPEPKMGPKKPDGSQDVLPAGPPPPRQQPTVQYCDGVECPTGDPGESYDEHMHQWCDVCGYQWLSSPVS